MRILSINHYTSITGVGTWTYTLLNAIKEIHPNIIVDIWFKTDNRDSLLIRQLSRVVDNIYFEKPDNQYDIVYTHYAEKEYPKTKKIYHFIHNIMSGNYMNPYADKIFCFSERVYNYIDFSNKELIRNGIDIKRFKYIKPKKELKNILVFDSRNNAFQNSKVLAASSMLGKYMSFLGEDLNHNIHNRWNVEDYIKSSDLVIAVGRSAIESLAMGKNVLIANINQANGLVTEDNFDEHTETNFSGWTKYRNDNYDVSYLAKQFKLYNPVSLRDLVIKKYNINLYIEQIITI